MGKTIKDVSEIKKIENGVVIEIIDNSVESEKLKRIVENCQTGKCDCMSEEVKNKVEFIDFKIENGRAKIEIGGNITEEEIKQAMEKSKEEL